MTRRVAVIGAGYWGKNLVRNFAQLRALHTVCDTDPVALRRHTEAYPEVCAADSFEQALQAPQIGAVVVATPAAMHYAHVKRALLAGKDVFVEKPLALRYSEGQELVRLAAEQRAILMVGHILVYHPAVTLLAETLARGELGRIWYIYSNRLNLGRVRQEENILWSFAPHDIAVICGLLDAEPVSVSACGSSYLKPGIVDVTVTNLVFDDDLRAHIFVSWLHPSKEQKLVLIGERKMAMFDDTAREGKLKIFDKGIEWRAGLPVPRQTSETTLFLEEAEPMRIECEHFLESIRTREPPRTDGASALRVLKVLEASQRSLERGGVPVGLAEIGGVNPAAAAHRGAAG